MKKMQKALLIVLVVALLIGVAGVAAGYVLGAHPLEIAGAILEGITAQTSVELPGFLSKTQTSAPPPAG